MQNDTILKDTGIVDTIYRCVLVKKVRKNWSTPSGPIVLCHQRVYQAKFRCFIWTCLWRVSCSSITSKVKRFRLQTCGRCNYCMYRISFQNSVLIRAARNS